MEVNGPTPHSTDTSKFAPYSEGLLAPLLPWLEDNEVSEILINKPKQIYVDKNGKLLPFDVPDYSEHMLTMLFQLIANENHQVLDKEQSLLSGSLQDGSRVQLVLPPTSKYPTLSIRRKVVRHLSLDDYKAQGFYDNAKAFYLDTDEASHLPASEKQLIAYYNQGDWDSFIRFAIELKKNIVISGATHSGKTTFLNACLKHMPISDRIITLEDTREIETPHDNQVNLWAPKQTSEHSQLTMQDLVQCCLRLRPDRIIMGEIRGREVLDFVSACSTGHEGSLTSIHANNPNIALMRMTQLYKLNNVPSMSDEDILRQLHAVIDIIIQITSTPVGRKVQSCYYRYGHLAKERA